MLVRSKHNIGIPASTPGLPFGVVGLEPVQISYIEGDQPVALRQFPVSLADVTTDYRCQGQTFPSVIVDIKKPSGSGPAASRYVQLSEQRDGTSSRFFARLRQMN
jgi:hypothetical protein